MIVRRLSGGRQLTTLLLSLSLFATWVAQVSADVRSQWSVAFVATLDAACFRAAVGVRDSVDASPQHDMQPDRRVTHNTSAALIQHRDLDDFTGSDHDTHRAQMPQSGMIALRFATRAWGVKRFLGAVWGGIGVLWDNDVSKLLRNGWNHFTKGWGLASAIVGMPGLLGSALSETLKATAAFGTSLFSILGWAGIIGGGFGVVESTVDIVQAAKALFESDGKKAHAWCLIGINGVKFAVAGVGLGASVLGHLGKLIEASLGALLTAAFGPLTELCGLPDGEDRDVSNLVPSHSFDDYVNAAKQHTVADGGKGSLHNDFRFSAYSDEEFRQIHKIWEPHASITLDSLDGVRFDPADRPWWEKTHRQVMIGEGVDRRVILVAKEPTKGQQKHIDKICKELVNCAQSEPDSRVAEIESCYAAATQKFQATDFCGRTIPEERCSCDVSGDVSVDNRQAYW